MVDTADLKSADRKVMRVRVSPGAPELSHLAYNLASVTQLDRVSAF